VRSLVARRLLAIPFLLLGISVVVFFTVHLIPGNPAEILAGGVYATPEDVARVEKQYGLDQPLPEQYLTYLGNLAQGDFGESLFARRSVTAELRDRLPASIELAFFALLVGAPIGALLGMYSALRRDSSSDYAFTATSLIGLSIPSFVLGLFLAWLFAVQFQWLPLSGRLDPFESVDEVTGLTTVDALVSGNWAGLHSAFRHLVLPVVTVAVIPLALFARYTRATFIEVLAQDYIRTAVAYGLPRRRVIWVYTAKNAMLPLVTLFGILVPAILVGTVLVETVFAWPGVGTLLVSAISTRDYAVVQSVTLVFALVYVVINLLVDVSYALLDPRTREQ
jgi:ABC-type dipeptide/oligopeptide/nickel transport system permease component